MYKDPAFIVPLSRIAIIMFHGNWAMIEWCGESGDYRGTIVYTGYLLKCRRSSQCPERLSRFPRPVLRITWTMRNHLINRLFINRYTAAPRNSFRAFRGKMLLKSFLFLFFFFLSKARSSLPLHCEYFNFNSNVYGNTQHRVRSCYLTLF